MKAEPRHAHRDTSLNAKKPPSDALSADDRRYTLAWFDQAMATDRVACNAVVHPPSDFTATHRQGLRANAPASNRRTSGLARNRSNSMTVRSLTLGILSAPDPCYDVPIENGTMDRSQVARAGSRSTQPVRGC